MVAHDRVERGCQDSTIRSPIAYLRDSQGCRPAEFGRIVIVVPDRVPPGVKPGELISPRCVSGVDCQDCGPKVKRVSVEVSAKIARVWVASFQFPSVDTLRPEHRTQGERVGGIDEPIRALGMQVPTEPLKF